MKFVVMYLNIRGLKSKIDSLQEKIEEVEPTIICITETHLSEAENIVIDGYTLYRNDRDSQGGGILIGIRNQLKNVCTVVEKNKEIEESIWIVIDNNKVKLRIGTIYAPQESRTSKENLKKMYENIMARINICHGVTRIIKREVGG